MIGGAAVLGTASAIPIYGRVEACALVAHRGYADLAPENTIEAIRTAVPTADAIEFDVRLAGDGTPVVIHDRDLDRLVGVDGSVDDYDAAELAAMDVLGSGEGIPDLRTFLEAVPADVGLAVEVKERRALEPTIELLGEVDSPALLSSFDADTLASARRLAPSLPRAYTFEYGADDPLATAIELDCSAVNPTLDAVLQTRILPRAHRAGLCVNVWTIRRRPAPSVLATLGVDGVIADSPLLPGARRGSRTTRWMGE